MNHQIHIDAPHADVHGVIRAVCTCGWQGPERPANPPTHAMLDGGVHQRQAKIGLHPCCCVLVARANGAEIGCAAMATRDQPFCFDCEDRHTKMLNQHLYEVTARLPGVHS